MKNTDTDSKISLPQALEMIKCRDGANFSFSNVNLAELGRLTGITRGHLRQLKTNSFLESVILAHDMERKWIQNHPVIQYENYLVKYIISEVVKYYQRKNISIFSFRALAVEGCSQDIEVKSFTDFIKSNTSNKTVLKWLDSDFTPLINDFFESNCINLNTSVRLLTDSDVLATAKNCLPGNDIIDNM